jgi:hypothetical protein
MRRGDSRGVSHLRTDRELQFAAGPRSGADGLPVAVPISIFAGRLLAIRRLMRRVHPPLARPPVRLVRDDESVRARVGVVVRSLAVLLCEQCEVRRADPGADGDAVAALCGGRALLLHALGRRLPPVHERECLSTLRVVPFNRRVHHGRCRGAFLRAMRRLVA